MAELAILMGKRKPRTWADMKKLSQKMPNMTDEKLEQLLHDLSEVGILEYNWENPQHEKQWVLPMYVPGSAEFTNMSESVLAEHPEMGRFLKE